MLEFLCLQRDVQLTVIFAIKTLIKVTSHYLQELNFTPCYDLVQFSYFLNKADRVVGVNMYETSDACHSKCLINLDKGK